MKKFDEKLSADTAVNWINGVVAGIEKEDFILNALLKKGKLQPEHQRIVRKARNMLLEVLPALDDLLMELK